MGLTTIVTGSAWIGYDWYRVDLPGGPRPRWRTNHSAGELGLEFRGTHTIGLRFTREFMTDPRFTNGYLEWRVFEADGSAPFVGTSARWISAKVGDLMRLRRGLDPRRWYRLEARLTRSNAVEALQLGITNVERWRDNVGVQGNFCEFVGFLADDSVQVRPWPAFPLPPLYYILIGDSLWDGAVFDPNGETVPGTTTPRAHYLRRDGGSVGWGVLAVQRAAAAMGMHPVGIRHAFGGWFGSTLHYPFQGFPDKAALYAAAPWILPHFEDDMHRRWHPTSPLFSTRMPDPQLVLYELGQNDRGTGKISGDPDGYVADLQANIATMKAEWDGVKILWSDTHVVDVPPATTAAAQRTLALQAFTDPPVSGDADPDLEFFATRDALLAGPGDQSPHPPASAHSYLADEAATLIQGLFA